MSRLLLIFALIAIVLSYRDKRLIVYYERTITLEWGKEMINGIIECPIPANVDVIYIKDGHNNDNFYYSNVTSVELRKQRKFEYDVKVKITVNFLISPQQPPYCTVLYDEVVSKKTKIVVGVAMPAFVCFDCCALISGILLYILTSQQISNDMCSKKVKIMTGIVVFAFICFDYCVLMFGILAVILVMSLCVK